MNNDLNFDFDFDLEDDVYVRPPDKPIREILNGSTGSGSKTIVNNYNSNFEDELQQCLLESEFLEEAKQFEKLEQMYKERKLNCEKVRQKLEKVRCYDISNKEIYETILSIIEMWELCQLEYFETDYNSYEAIYKIIKSVRLTMDEHKFLNELIKVTK
jgi:hypothetical protein